MKELSIEEKAKAYDNIIKKANKMHSENCEACQMCIEELIPELKESEDERIKEDLIQWINEFPDTIWRGHYKKDVIAWLEKQGEQKSVDKTKPNFKVGDFIVNDYCMGKVTELTNDAYLLDTEQGIPFSCEHNAHFWTIQDAKAGDVLAFDNETIVIFKDLYNATTFHSYCHIEDGVFTASEKDVPDWWEGKGFQPATKEQRDLLFQKMKEAGYEWNAKEKELKKIEQNDILEDTTIDNNEDGLIAETIKYKNDQNLAWSEEDESRITTICTYLQDYARLSGSESRTIRINEYCDWLKSLNHQSRWKPSDEQMEALEHFVRGVGESGYASPYDNNTKLLYSLLQDLKKLKEE